jgi:hypothetical protein
LDGSCWFQIRLSSSLWLKLLSIPGRYPELHLRVEPREPLAGVAIGVEELAGLLDVAPLPGGIVLNSAGRSARVVDGIAFAQADGRFLYGWAPHGQLRALALHPVDGNWSELMGSGFEAAIDELMDRHQLVTVDWRGRRWTRQIATLRPH